MRPQDHTQPLRDGVAPSIAGVRLAKRGRPTKEYKIHVKDERRVLLLRGTKTKWVRGLRYLYAELLKAYFGHPYDAEVKERFGDLFLSVMQAYFAEEKRPMRRYLPALTFLLWQSYGMVSDAARLEWAFERIDWGIDAVFGESELTRRVLRLAAVVCENNPRPPTWLKDWGFYAEVQRGGLIPKAKPNITLTLTDLLSANYPFADWLKFFAIEAGRADLLLRLEKTRPVLKKPNQARHDKA
jgi:hypothetical protein